MCFMPSFQIGATVTNQQISAEFRYGNMGGMRRSKRTQTLVIISDHTKSLYDDKWYGDVLHYTEKRKRGDQTLEFQNKTLAQSDINGITVHLFEALRPKQYIYHGVVKLAESPYQEDQPDEDGKIRKVWMFPIKPLHLISISGTSYQCYEKEQRKKAEKMSVEALKQRIQGMHTKQTAQRQVTSTVFVRDPCVAEYAKRRAEGICQLCKQPAPFLGKDGQPYLENHHITWLSRGGTDTIDNTVALCPNCHKKMHVIDDPQDVQTLHMAVKLCNHP